MKNDNDQQPDAPDFFEEETKEEENVNAALALDSDQQQPGVEEVPPELEDDEGIKPEAKAAPVEEKLVIVNDPYIAGQCTTRVTLVISPQDGHELGPLVFIAASTHEDLPGTFLTCRLQELTLPPQIMEAIASAHANLSQRGEEKQAALQLAAQKKREADAKEQQRKQKMQVQTRKEAEKKKADEKRANEPTTIDMYEALQ